MIVLWGIADERPLAAVRTALAERGAPCFVLDQRGVFELSLDVTFGRETTGRLVGPGGTIDLAAVRAVYARPYDPTLVPAVAKLPRTSHGHVHAVTVHQAFRAWTEVTGARVINRVAAMSSNSSKPYQSMLLADMGFAVPRTLVTTDPECARVFLDEVPDAIYKSVSDVRSVVARVGAAQRKRLGMVAGCPTQFQEYVAGTDIRVHVVGDHVFPCEIRSDATDYRYPGEHAVERRPYTLPDEIRERCRSGAHAMGLPVAGIDLRLTPAGEWYCFEVNPSPAFTYYDIEDGRIARALAELLATAPARGAGGEA
jgi:glutathione synthase/RimK-type ligase-like ATP-grasp enzyme